MMSKSFFLSLVLLLAFTGLSSSAKNETEERNKRQISFLDSNDLPLDFRLPVSLAFYSGEDDPPIDNCPRSQVFFRGQCRDLLEQGPCDFSEMVIIDTSTNRPTCAPRLCNYDRIFIFEDQRCWDPLDKRLCTGDRQAFMTMNGMPICQCPLGTYESGSSHGDTCIPLLERTYHCPYGEVFWFWDFDHPPECLPDPCGGANLRRHPDELPFVPFSDGKCFQLGSMPDVCPAETWVSIALSETQGVCSTLDVAGYEIVDDDTLEKFKMMYGPPINRGRSPNPQVSTGHLPPSRTYSSGRLYSYSRGGSQRHLSGHGVNVKVQKNLLPRKTPGSSSLFGNFGRKLRAYFQRLARSFTRHLLKKRPHNRYRRQAAGGTAIDTQVVACRGKQKINGLTSKCRDVFTIPGGRPTGGSPSNPVSAAPSCQGGRINEQRVCERPTQINVNLG